MARRRHEASLGRAAVAALRTAASLLRHNRVVGVRAKHAHVRDRAPIVDTEVLRLLRTRLPGYPGVAVDASMALLDFAFGTLRLDYVTSVFLAGNALPRRVNVLAGGRYAGDAERERPDGSRVLVTCMRLTREDWLARRAPGSAARLTAAA